MLLLFFFVGENTNEMHSATRIRLVHVFNSDIHVYLIFVILHLTCPGLFNNTEAEALFAVLLYFIDVCIIFTYINLKCKI